MKTAARSGRATTRASGTSRPSKTPSTSRR
ncbi:UNVERIFIED_CONTAM: hypothetical protein H355_012326 [Colinus virginianus]|nr:hypothetical protein H355_012326 [Colinus virginianus]